MISSKALFNFFKNKKIEFFVGVPDSLQKNLESNLNKIGKNHIIASNEGSAIAIASGYFLSSNKIPVVYMQNSGLGNAINPLTSIASNHVYNTPLILMIGWRGNPKINDEPQHKFMGKITNNLLDLLKIKHCNLNKKQDLQKFSKLIDLSKKNNEIIAVTINKKTFKPPLKKKKNIKYKNLRINFIKEILTCSNKNFRFFTSTGYLSREFDYINKNFYKNKFKCLYNVGGMGHTSSLSLGFSLNSKNKVFCLDGDGSLIMHMGSLVTISSYKKNFKYILFNNGTHESVGAQKTNSKIIDFKKYSKSIGFEKYYSSKSTRNFKKKFFEFINDKKKSFFEIKFNPGSINNLSRPENFKFIGRNMCG